MKTVKTIRANVQRLEDRHRPIIQCGYRAFDDRWCYFSGSVMDRPRAELTEHVAWRENLQILASRQLGAGAWQHVGVADKVVESCYISDATTEQNYCFPLRLFGADNSSSENLSHEFRSFLDDRYDHHYSPEEILGYIYAILHAPTYRRLYGEFLRIDFPRIPFAEEAEDFEMLSALGWALVQAHLLRNLPRRKLADYHGRGTNLVEHVRWSAEDRRISINAIQSFCPVPEGVWDFHIGGYQVVEKYLKSRKGRMLSLDEINHVARIADALAFTIEQMEAIDAAYQQAFPNGG